VSDIRRLHERIADLEVQLSTKMDEIERLTAERDEWQRQHDLKDHRCFALAQRAEKAEAEIARLREALADTTEALAKFVNTKAETREPYETALSAYDRGIAALKPDTGEKP